ncbi:MAG: hypothetical protein PVG41_05075 [Desulfobacteraceae bacterium]|jgi:hypothetical protein
MIFGAQIGLLIYGIIAIIRGQYSMRKGRKVIGSKARLLGAVCMAPIPLAMIAGTVIGFLNPDAVIAGELKGLIAGIEIAILICTILSLILLTKTFYKQQEGTALEK